jgi:hypothetical protein
MADATICCRHTGTFSRNVFSSTIGHPGARLRSPGRVLLRPLRNALDERVTGNVLRQPSDARRVPLAAGQSIAACEPSLPSTIPTRSVASSIGRPSDSYRALATRRAAPPRCVRLPRSPVIGPRACADAVTRADNDDDPMLIEAVAISALLVLGLDRGRIQGARLWSVQS